MGGFWEPFLPGHQPAQLFYFLTNLSQGHRVKSLQLIPSSQRSSEILLTAWILISLEGIHHSELKNWLWRTYRNSALAKWLAFWSAPVKNQHCIVARTEWIGSGSSRWFFQTPPLWIILKGAYCIFVTVKWAMLTRMKSLLCLFCDWW